MFPNHQGKQYMAYMTVMTTEVLCSKRALARVKDKLQLPQEAKVKMIFNFQTAEGTQDSLSVHK